MQRTKASAQAAIDPVVFVIGSPPPLDPAFADTKSAPFDALLGGQFLAWQERRDGTTQSVGDRSKELGLLDGHGSIR